MKPLNPISTARNRCSILAALLQDARGGVHARHQKWIELGVVAAGDKHVDALAKIHNALDELESLIAHVTILDMAAALESAARSKLGNTVGQVRQARKDAEKRTRFPVYSASLIADARSFSSLKSLATLLKGHLDADIDAGFKISREARNNYAHGTDVMTSPTIDVEDAHRFLKKIYEIL